MLGTPIALVWVNLERESYVRLAHRLHFIVNDIGMAFFFALAAKEVTEATAPGRRAALAAPRGMPLVAAVGGMLGPALIFVTMTIVLDRPNLERGWAIPCATDIAFSYLAARIIFGAKHPAIPFLLLLAIADDAIGLLIIAASIPTGPLRPLDLTVFLGAGMLVAVVACSKRRVVSFWPYILAGGGLSWIGFYRGGVHPALALVPIIPFLPHAERDPGLFVERPDAHDTLERFEHRFKRPVDVMLFFFGLVNAGVVARQRRRRHVVSCSSRSSSANPWHPAATVLWPRGGLRLPAQVTWRDMTVVGIIAGIGFTVALFFATAAFPYGRLLDETKIGALLSFALLIGLLAAKVLKVGRFS